MYSRSYGAVRLPFMLLLGFCAGVASAAAPVAFDQTVDFLEGASITLCGTDADSDPLTYMVETQPTQGDVFGAGPEVTYQPGPGFAGSDSFTFSVNDGTATSNIATVTINSGGGSSSGGECSGTGGGGNTAPVADDQTLSVDQDTALPITLTGFDAENDPLTFSVQGGPTNGSLSGTAPLLTYTPNAGFSGSDSFTFVANDGTVDSSAATVSITVNAAVNTPPVADDQTLSVDENMPLMITLTGSDADDDPLSFSGVSDPGNGSVSVSGADVIYTPTADFNGSDSFTFVVNDGTVDSSAATVSITVNAVNAAPLADDQAVDAGYNTPLEITLTGSDEEDDPLTFIVQSSPANGTLSGTLPTLTYTPATGFGGNDSFTFVANDGLANSAEATVAITVAFKRLNDTGVTLCLTEVEVTEGEASRGTSVDCQVVGATADMDGFDDSSGAVVPAAQDAHFGRDVTDPDDSDGHAGFSFTKLDSNGEPLADQTVSYGTGAGQALWQCVKDNVTGLTWEVKSTDGNDTYSWFTAEEFVADVNEQAWCGATDWRLPDREELLSIVNWNGVDPAIDSGYFPNTQRGHYWTSSLTDGRAWSVLFSIPESRLMNLSASNFVRLVRGTR